MRLILALIALLALALPAAEISKADPRVRNVCVDVPTAGDPHFSVEVICEVLEGTTVIAEHKRPTVTLTPADFDADQLAAYNAFKAALLAAVAAKQVQP